MKAILYLMQLVSLPISFMPQLGYATLSEDFV